MKRITAIFIMLLILISLVACKDEEPGISYPSRTAAFYGTMDFNSFWFTMEFTNNGITYDFTQATNGKAVTTIEDHADNSRDIYQIYDKTCVNKLYTASKVFDTLIGPYGQDFLFAGYEPSMFAEPTEVSEKTVEGVTYHCESFVTSSISSTNVSSDSRNNYYFIDDRLKVVEIIDNGRTVMLMQIKDYSNTIPSDIYMTVPADYKAGKLEQQGSDVSYDDVSDEWGIG